MQDLTIGSVKKHVRSLSIPFFISNILVMLNYVIDSAWLGRMVGEKALAASSVSNVIVYILAALLIGITTGSSIIISQYFGAKKYRKIEFVFKNSITLGVVIYIAVIVIIYTLGKPILQLLNVPLAVLPLSLLYLQTLVIGFFSLFLFYLLSSLYRAVGNSKIPLLMAIITVSINFFLDPMLIGGFYFIPKLGVQGAAISTIITNTLAVVVGGLVLRYNKKIKINILRFGINLRIMKTIIAIGIPTMIENGVLSLGFALTQFIINSFGIAAMAAYGVVGNVDNFIYNLGFSIGGAVAVIVGQNIGSGHITRANDSVKYAIFLGVIVTAVISCICFVFPRQICEIFLHSQSEDAILIGISYLKIMALPYIFVTVEIVLISFFNGAGDTIAAMIVAMISVWILRLPFAYGLSKVFGLNGVWYGIAVSFSFAFLGAVIYYFTGRWKHKRIT